MSEESDESVISLSGITKTFSDGAGHEVRALRGIDLQIHRGEIFGVIGLSGAGKSTLIRIINMLEKPTSGKVVVLGRELSGMAERQLRLERRRMGMIFQSFNLLSSATVRQNVAFPLEIDRSRTAAEIEARVRDLLELVGLADKADSYPAQLSGGQKQRVGIARALACQPEILLCDEATSALDPKTTSSILELLKSLREKLRLTIVIITHQMEVIKECCDRVAVLDGGVIAELGKTIDVFASPKGDLTRRLVAAAVRSGLSDLLERMELSPERTPGSRAVMELLFLGERANDPVIADVCAEHHVSISILGGSIHHIQNQPLGILIVAVDGAEETVREALEALRGRVYRAEFLGYVKSGAAKD